MDTKWKKTHKFTVMLISLCILLPAMLLVFFYPDMEAEMLKRKEAYEQEQKNQKEQRDIPSIYIDDSLVNYAVEATYCMYGLMIQEIQEEKVDFQVLDENGWTNDYYTMLEECEYLAEYTGKKAGTKAETSMGNTDKALEKLWDAPDSKFLQELADAGVVGYLLMKYNSFGQFAEIRLEKFSEDVVYEGNPYKSARNSVNQYQQNSMYEKDTAQEVCPKDFQAVFLIYEDSIFTSSMEDFGNYSYIPNVADLYWSMGAEWIILILAVFVALAALLLPFVKRLETGWERLFCISLEAVLVISGIGLAAVCGMFVLMSHSTMYEIMQTAEQGRQWKLIGYTFTPENQYRMLLVLNFFGWAACFFMEYIVVAAFRQFLCGPWKYLKERSFCLKVCRMGKNFCKKVYVYGRKYAKKFYRYITNFDLTEHFRRSILKIIAVNFVVLVFFCSFWFFGIAGLVVYSVILYILLAKYGEKLQKQYQSILEATAQMANGNLKIVLAEELGILAPLGEELEKVQQGFAKAVEEEAKSQKMKTELISNMSHDLKTPLTAIITYVDLLKQEDLSEEERTSYIQTLEQKSNRMKLLIEDLFEVSKANSGNVQMHFMDVDIVSLMKQVHLEMEDTFQESTLTFRWNLPDEKVILSLDGQKIYRVFENLLNNILKYSLPYTRAYIDILNGDGIVEVIFRNISAAELEVEADRLTERFVRGDVSRKTEGSGLGLAIVKSFVELQNGTVEICVDGDLFKVTLRWEKERV